MVSVDHIKEALREEKDNLTRLGIERVGIFGSYVRGEAKPDSDIDLLIDIAPDSMLTLFSLVDIEQRLSEKLNNKIDIVIKSDLKPYIYERILSEVVYVS
jgi:uncharacterized protein